MSRYRTYGQLDDKPQTLGDPGFIGVNEKLSPEQLDTGFASRAINKRMREGAAATRSGTIKPAPANAVPFAQILGSGVYSNPNGEVNLLLATADSIYRAPDNGIPMPVPIPADQTIDTPSEFVQAFDKLLVMRGTTRVPLVWNGIDQAGFTLPPPPSNATKDTIANAETAEVFKNRLLVPADRDNVQVSDILDYTQYDPILESWRINKGTADRLVRIYPYANAGVVMFKERSILILVGFTDQDHPEAASLEPINENLGIGRARRSVIQAGTDCLFVSEPGGIYRLSQVDVSRISTPPIPVSDPIAKTIKRINWGASAGIVSAVLGEYAYWAVPLDDNTINNAILVYNIATDKWETSFDTWDGQLTISALHVMPYRDENRLYAIDYATRTIYVLYEGQTDLLASGERQVVDLLDTRGYCDNGQDPELLNFRRARVSLSTWNPNAVLTAITDGANEELPGPSILRDPLKYFTFGTADYDPTNANDDAGAPRREDYSVTGEAPGFDPDDNGVDPDLKQDSVEPMAIERTGRWVSIRIQNTQGQCDVRAVEIEAIPTSREIRRAA